LGGLFGSYNRDPERKAITTTEGYLLDRTRVGKLGIFMKLRG